MRFIKDYNQYVLCREFHWTEEEINNTSAPFIEFCMEQLQNENERGQEELNKIKDGRR